MFYRINTIAVRNSSVSTMKAAHLFLFLHVFSTAGVLVNAFDPITTTVVLGVGATLGRTIWNYLHESCDPKWVAFNGTGEHVRHSNV